MNETLTLEFDGGSRGNPGPAGIGVVVRAEDGTPLVTLGRFIGRATNNVAEYKALITALREAQKLGATRIYIRGDSELIIKQIKGLYRVKHPDMRTLYDEAKSLLAQFKEHKIDHNLRHKNELADQLANLAMDKRADVTEVLEKPSSSSPARTAGGEEALVERSAAPAMREGDRLECPRCKCAIEIATPSTFPQQKLKRFVCACGGAMGTSRASRDHD